MGSKCSGDSNDGDAMCVGRGWWEILRASS